MTTCKAYIKNMVCDRCIMVVHDLLTELGIAYTQIQMGEVDLTAELSEEDKKQLARVLTDSGFELLDDNKSMIIEKIKNIIIQTVHRNGDGLNIKYSALLSDKLQLDYHYLTTLFSSVEGLTIEKYIILQRVEKAKELLHYDQQNLSEIANQLCYSSVQHLSQQFKKVTGLTPSAFKQLKDMDRMPLDKIGS